MPDEPIVVRTPRRIAGKFMGGFVPAVSYHFGVLEVLRERGFVLRGGFRDPGQPRETGPPGIDLAVGSSAGAFFVTAACAGVGKDELLGAVNDGAARVEPFRARYLGEGDGLVGKTLEWVRSGPRVSWAERRTWKSWAAESTINVLFPLWRLDPIGRYLYREVLDGRDWEDLRTEAAILVVDLNHPLTLILGEQESPVLELFREQPVAPEAIHRILGSEGGRIVRAFEEAGVDPAHPALAPFRERPEVRNTALHARGVGMPCAAIGSMATYPLYAPVHLTGRDGEPFRLGHYEVVAQDGEDRNPFTTDVAEERGADLILVSSISAPYKYLHGLGSLHRMGYNAMHQQKSFHSRDSKQEDVLRFHREHRRLHAAARAILEEHGCGREAIERLEAEFHRIAWINNVRVRITPDTDIAAENHMLRRLDPLAFTVEEVNRAFDLGVTVARRVLKRYRFEFLDE